MLNFQKIIKESCFGPPFVQRSVFLDGLRKLGPYQAFFYGKRNTVIYSNPMKRVWEGVEKDSDLEEFAGSIEKIVHSTESPRVGKWIERCGSERKPFVTWFVSSGSRVVDASRVGIGVVPMETGIHAVLLTSDNREQSEEKERSFLSTDFSGIRKAFDSWTRESEIEAILSIAIRMLPEYLKKHVSFHRETASFGTNGVSTPVAVSYRRYSEKGWVREMYEQKSVKRDLVKMVRSRGIKDGPDVWFDVPMMVGRVESYFCISVNKEVFTGSSRKMFQSYIMEFEKKSVDFARTLLSPDFAYARYATGSGVYAIEGIRKVSEKISEGKSGEAVMIPIMGVGEKEVLPILEISRSSDPVFFDKEMNVAMILLRGWNMDRIREKELSSLSGRFPFRKGEIISVSDFISMRSLSPSIDPENNPSIGEKPEDLRQISSSPPSRLARSH